ncbi:MAG TPA: hypothetical protein VLX09_00045 [Stellaceae bacterium]|nr:hypothetical protein [Stellaceae bacterium]
MSKWLWRGVLATAIALPALSGAAWADGCSDATLQGEYAFGATLYTPHDTQGMLLPYPEVVTGIKYFDGRGHLKQQDYTGDTGANTDFGMETGTYSVKQDCTGEMEIILVPGNPPLVVLDIKIVISNGGNHIHEVVAALTSFGNPVHPTQTSADDWKVEGENQQ